MGVVIAVVSLFGAGALAGATTFLYFGTYWARMLDERVWGWDLDDEEGDDEE